ncbi:MAG: CHAP domain-containing protein [Actinomycetes bacterium]
MVFAVGITFGNSFSAQAVTSNILCSDGIDSSYHCVSAYGYTGIDSYGYYKFSSYRPDGSYPHNCTAFAAYMLSIFNVYDRNISLLGNASEWDNNAYKVQGSIVGITPHVGDIANWDYYGGTAGHVAFVQSLINNSSGTVIGIVAADDGFTSRKTALTEIYRRNTANGNPNDGWPDHFLTFLRQPNGGGPGWVALSETIPNS